jgi:mRNA-degrading endonuclease RelE of RelBE toxin-antitoxin system
MFTVEIDDDAKAEIKALKAFVRTAVVAAIRDKLATAPVDESDGRKLLEGFEPPLWRLQVGEYRVYYTVDALTSTVTVVNVRLKGRLTTDESLE